MAIHFGDFTLDESQRQLFRGAEPVHLSPKAFQLLSILIHHHPRAVSKQELQELLWPGTFVNEGNLTSAVAEVRTALGDDRREARFIRTLYGFGYAFVAETHNGEQKENKGSTRWIAIAVAASIIVVAIVALLPRHAATEARAASTPPQPIRSLAVLPFDTTTADSANQHLGTGLADLLITRLSNVRQLIVRPTSAVRGFAGRSSLDAGRQLKVDAVLEGSIQTTPDRVRVTVQLLNVREQKPIWAGEFDQKRTDVLGIEDAISSQVATALMVQLGSKERALLVKRYTTNPDAYNLYLQARYLQDLLIREGNFNSEDAIALMRAAITKDPSYALAWASLGEMYAGAGAFNQIPPKKAFPSAKAAVQKALRLDDEISEAHCAAGIISMYWDLDYSGAEKEFQRALELNPRNTHALTHYGRLVQCLGRFDEAIALRKREIEIDPLNPGVQSFLAAAYLTARKDDLGIQQCQLVLRMDPNFSAAHIYLARIYALRGEHDKAIAEGREAVRTDNGKGYGMQSHALLGYALATAGKRDEAAGILERLKKAQKAQPFDIAIVELALGNRGEALTILEKAVDERTYGLRLKTEPIFEPLHSDPRFQALLARAGFRS